MEWRVYCIRSWTGSQDTLFVWVNGSHNKVIGELLWWRLHICRLPSTLFICGLPQVHSYLNVLGVQYLLLSNHCHFFLLIDLLVDQSFEDINLLSGRFWSTFSHMDAYQIYNKGLFDLWIASSFFLVGCLWGKFTESWKMRAESWKRGCKHLSAKVLSFLKIYGHCLTHLPGISKTELLEWTILTIEGGRVLLRLDPIHELNRP